MASQAILEAENKNLFHKTMDDEKIKFGDYIVIQRQKYIKLHKFSNADSVAALGKDQIELQNIEAQPWFTTFKMIPKNSGGRRLCFLEACADISGLREQLDVNVAESGQDNRNILADVDSQTLTPDEIEKLRESCSSSNEIVNQLVENSKTFASKTEYSQDKYLRKKEKKYFEYVQIRKPSIRMIAEIMYRQDAEKICGLRMDSLSQLLTYANVSANGNYLVFESGTNGLVPAAVLNALGANTTGKLVHMHPGNVPQKQALLALNLEKEQLDRCISVNFYSALRHFYQNSEPIATGTSSGTKRKIDETVANGENGDDQHPAKVAKTDNGHDVALDVTDNCGPTVPTIVVTSENAEDTVIVTGGDGDKTPPRQTPRWVLDNEKGCELLRENLDALIVVSREHPGAIIKALLPFIKSSRPMVVFNSSREILSELLIDLKASGQMIGLRITSNWLRNYQVLPNRTHPDVLMNGNSGFLLCGFTIR